MTRFEPAGGYRRDIDGLRAIAVLAVMGFHFGFLRNGFLGVDIFFVISGFLITGIIYHEISEARFSMVRFYLRRTRRILPLAVFISAVALCISAVTMLPDDMENLAQSVIASNFFANNILQALTTKNYWDVVNEYKPLMHTWSLGLEEQYYLLYPPLLWMVGSRRPKWLLPILVTVALGSVLLVFLPFQGYVKFYMLPFRFYELAAGGIAAILLKNRLIRHAWSAPLIAVLVLLLLIDIPHVSHEAGLLLAVATTVGILVTQNSRSRISAFILENRLTVGVGLISYSVYMWHQVLLAYARYFLFGQLHAVHLAAVFLVTLALSIVTYLLVEKPCRNKNRVSVRTLLMTLGVAYVVTNGFAFYIYANAGVLRDVPELDIDTSHVSRGMHANYNLRIFYFDRSFQADNKVKVLVVGNSFARDWANVLLESRYAGDVEISYTAETESTADLHRRVLESDVIFYSPALTRDRIRAQGIDEHKLHVVGTKSFGTSNGIFYNHLGGDYYGQRTRPESGCLENNAEMRAEWADRYVDYFAKVLDKDSTVPVFTPSGKFISQDCRHLTRAGARYFAELFDKEIGRMVRQGHAKP